MQTLTPYHAKYYAYELTRRCPPDSEDRLASALVDAQVDLNPHQIDASLFAFRSPLSRGVLLADEVGLGKTIEAGLVLAQKWAERRRRMLVITPSNLRKQWHQELTDIMIRNDAELKVMRERVAAIEQLIQRLRPSARPEEWPALSSGYRFEIERMQGEILDYLVEGAPPALSR